MVAKKLWEILVPQFSNKHKEYSVKFHKVWDDKVKKISGGLTILRTAKGHWQNPKGKLFVEKMIPVRIYCTKKEINKIIALTMDYYNQEAVMAYKISNEVIVKHRKQ